MSYYDLDGARGEFISYGAYSHKRTVYVRRLLAAALLILFAAGSSAAGKMLAQTDNISRVQIVSAAASPSGQPYAGLPAVTLSDERSEGLRTKLESWADDNQSSRWGFYVSSVGSSDGFEVRINDTAQFQMASIYKLFLLKPLAQKLPSEAWATTMISERSYHACVEAMLAVSDNPCAEAIAGRLGWTTTHNQLQLDGYRQTVLNREDLFATTAADTGLLLDRLYHGDGYDAKTRSVALDALSASKGSEAVRKSCAGCAVYNKTGDLSGFRHDAAIVEKDGRSYVVVIFSEGASWPLMAEAAQLITSIL